VRVSGVGRRPSNPLMHRTDAPPAGLSTAPQKFKIEVTALRPLRQPSPLKSHAHAQKRPHHRRQQRHRLELARALAARATASSSPRATWPNPRLSSRTSSPATRRQRRGDAARLGDFADVDRFAKELLAKMPVIDVLALNSGSTPAPPAAQRPGSHDRHHALRPLPPHPAPARSRESRAAGRIVVTSSLMHNYGKIDEASFTDATRHKRA